MNTCPNETEWVLYVAGELDAARAAELHAHLASCQACARQASRLARGLKALEMIDRDVPMRPQAMDALRRRLQTEAARPKSTILTLVRRWPWAAAASLLLALTLAWAMWPSKPTTTIPREIVKNNVTNPPVHFTPDSAIQDRLTEISIDVLMMEDFENGLTPEKPAVAPASKIEDMDPIEYYNYLESLYDA
jgi:hypothetical protein